MPGDYYADGLPDDELSPQREYGDLPKDYVPQEGSTRTFIDPFAKDPSELEQEAEEFEVFVKNFTLLKKFPR